MNGKHIKRQWLLDADLSAACDRIGHDHARVTVGDGQRQGDAAQAAGAQPLDLCGVQLVTDLLQRQRVLAGGEAVANGS